MLLPVKREIAAGSMLLVVASIFALLSIGLEIGVPSRMGPGFFPLILSALLMVIGLYQILQGLRRSAAPMRVSRDELIALTALLAALLVFAFAIIPLGFLIAGFLTTYVAQVGGSGFRRGRAALVGVAVTLLCWAVFVAGLGLRLPVLPARF